MEVPRGRTGGSVSAEADAGREHLAHTLLRPPEVPTDEAMMAWGHRLRRGVEQKVITYRQANEVWRAAISKLVQP